MQYKCKTIPLTTLLVGPYGLVTSLCDRCLTKDCENPIENKIVSIMGVSRNIRSYMKGDDAYFVIECQGYTE